MDGDGHAVHAPIALQGRTQCFELGASPGGFSFVAPAAGAVDLVGVTTGASTVLESLSRPGTPYFPGSRLLLPDESFLLPSWSAVDGGEEIAIEHYDASGELLAPPATLAQSTQWPVLLSRVGDSVLASFGCAIPGQPCVYVRPLTLQGIPAAPASALTDAVHPAPIGAYSLDGSPSGDAIITWSEEASGVSLLELDPRGVPRGPATSIDLLARIVQGVRVLVGDDGDHALVVWSGEIHGGDGPGVYTLPLVCSAH
jgi:hypothetical protein